VAEKGITLIDAEIGGINRDILLTHRHPDHVGTNPKIIKMKGITSTNTDVCVCTRYAGNIGK
jgi:glyoxylase-like metal-dependent hydrolase (beta-lactamase superfamily II)